MRSEMMKSVTTVKCKNSSTKNTDGDILHGDNLQLLRKMKSESVSLIYIDPPFNTGKTQNRTRIITDRAEHGDRVGFGKHRYNTIKIHQSGYNDRFDDYLGFLRARLIEAHRILAANGSLFFHIDWREAARCRLLLEEIFGGAQHCINEIIWVYDFGARNKNRWSTKHDNIYWFAKDPSDYIYNYGAIDRIGYLAPGLVGDQKAKRGKTPTDAWWQTIVPTNGNEKTGYPTQKPLAILDRIVRVHSNPGDTVLDFFAGSGTTGIAARNHERKYILIDESREAIKVMNARFRQKPSAVRGVSDQYIQMVKIFNRFRLDYCPEALYTPDRPFEWVKGSMASGRLGAFGKKVVRAFLTENGFFVDSYTGRGVDFTVNDCRAASKISTLWANGAYKFQQIRKDDYEFIFFLGVSPSTVNIWVASKAELVWKDITGQHGGQQGSDTRWITCDPSMAPYAWMYPQNGNPSAICRHLRRMLRENR